MKILITGILSYAFWKQKKKKKMGAKIDNAIDINSIIGQGRSEGAKYDVAINIDSKIGDRGLGWTEAKGAEIDLAIDIKIDSEIREGRAGLGWGIGSKIDLGGLRPRGLQMIPRNIDRRLGWAEAKGAEIDLVIDINIDTISIEGRAGMGCGGLSLRGIKPDINSDIGKAILLAISVLIDIDSNIGRAGLGQAESEGAKTDINSNIEEGRAGLSLRWLQTILLSICAESGTLLYIEGRQFTKPAPRALACFPTAPLQHVVHISRHPDGPINWF
ncbi:hypothetical protein PPACK8108_LOCUS9205 [Phakopsora pachyrhizi]|uniref:Uncharacterized protein n=1 Tax=Phakopsora pachyrhizi TaxID=170000 RepID=A0AAV0AY32_PHAPC|nr:hypothetical protein PPACK8108_LOCUS9205 [Phakopsora pachyrhizi]